MRSVSLARAVAVINRGRLFSSLAHGRVHNFNAGPGALPLEALEEAKRDLLNWYLLIHLFWGPCGKSLRVNSNLRLLSKERVRNERHGNESPKQGV